MEADRSEEFTAAGRQPAEQWGEDCHLGLHGPLLPCTFVRDPLPGGGAE
ncbi:hypothetical protein GCM10023235_78150 [Kitasatospora terrestris]|uniref:Uncharacterized protein n=1 Tax=Kitasatospora terrestris TaxID=258051 RepID=A0ABP9EUA4_9ACTN